MQMSDILTEARGIIYGEREQTYGDPGKNLRIIADYWNTYLISKGFDFLEGLDFDDVSNMMVLMKIARLGNTPLHHDSMVDICGYMALADRVQGHDNGTSNAEGNTGRTSPDQGMELECAEPVRDLPSPDLVLQGDEDRSGKGGGAGKGDRYTRAVGELFEEHLFALPTRVEQDFPESQRITITRRDS
jgi:hypothetical protein